MRTQFRMWFVLAGVGLAAACGGQAIPVDRTVVAVESGRVSGAPVDGDVWVYKGIPFAAPPIGSLRWRPPQPVAAWDGVRDATAFGPACMQAKRGEGSFYGQIVDRMDEDCLYLNVWTPAAAGAALPVMVWIHGGGLTSGHGSEVTYDGTNMARRGVVLITINYRLGPFGYLAHPLLSAESEHNASGNYGTLDQLAALRWVKQNIAAFGGDPGRVTIFGESAGSWSVNHLMASPLSAGLFQRAIGESGGGFGSSGTAVSRAAAEASGEGFAAGALGPDVEPTLVAMRAKTADEIMAAPRTGVRFSANVDGWVFPDTIYHVFAAGRQQNVPVIVGSNANESATLGGGRGGATLAEYRAEAHPTYGALADDFLATYPAASDADVVKARVAGNTDLTFGWEMRTWARMMDTVSSPAYQYFFSHVPPGPDADRNGAFHAGEIIYAFNNLGKSPYPYANGPYGDVDRQLSNRMASYWVNFAATGDPNGEGLPVWPAYDTQADTALEFGDTVQVSTGIRKDRLDFIDRYYAAERAKATN